MPKSMKNNLEKTVGMVKAGEISQRPAALWFKIPQSTLSDISSSSKGIEEGASN